MSNATKKVAGLVLEFEQYEHLRNHVRSCRAQVGAVTSFSAAEALAWVARLELAFGKYFDTAERHAFWVTPRYPNSPRGLKVAQFCRNSVLRNLRHLAADVRLRTTSKRAIARLEALAAAYPEPKLRRKLAAELQADDVPF